MKRFLKNFSIVFLFACINDASAQIIPNSSTTQQVSGVKLLPPAFTNIPRNFLRTYSPQIPIQDTLSVNMSSLVDNVQTSIVFADSYGRTVETVAKQLSPNRKDNVAIGNYDEFGRAGTTSYMPYAALSNDGAFKPNAFAEDSIFYKNLYPLEQVIYSQTHYDGSPINIPIKGLAQGNEWGGLNRGKTLTHRSSTIGDSVRYWYINIISEDDLPITTTYYLPGSLSVKEITDERGIKYISYTDVAGRTILSKTQEANSPSTGNTGWLCTYYVYDEMGSLRTVIPPKAMHQLPSANWQLPTVALQGLCYSYFYDKRGRQITKSIPGKGKSYIAYDLLDRPVMTQDPNLRQTNEWAFVLYDAQSRPVRSGIIYSNLTKDIIQYQAANSNSYPSLSGTHTVMTETYYDDYDWIAATGAPVSNNIDGSNINPTNFFTNFNVAPDYAQPIIKSNRIRGAVTGTKTMQLGSANYSYNVTFYDAEGRAIQTQQNSSSTATASVSTATMQYSFKGTVLRSHVFHNKSGTNAQSHTMLTKYGYDHVGRLLTTTKNIDNLGDKIISQNSYEETGQVKTKTIGGGLQVQNYSYNLQGMLTAINAPYVTSNSSSSNEYFGEILSYANGFTTNQYNGNIAGVKWKNAGDGIARAYGYSYDNVGRLTTADFTQQNSGSTAWTNNKVDYTVKGLTYDAGGNILSMTQRGLLGVGGNTTIDSLAYSYFANSNRLQKVADAAVGGGLGDFKDSINNNYDYIYDVNGNIVADNNRHLHNPNGSIGTVFNLLDKPDSMAVAGRSCTYYTYDATGNTLSKTVKDYKSNTVKKYTYISGFVYLSNTPTGTNQAGADTLQYAMFEEGRMRWKIPPSGGAGTFVFDYFLKDHAGNIRTVITDEVRTDDYPAATMDTTTAIKNIENAIYAGLDLTRVTKPSGYPAADDLPIPNANIFVAKVQGNAGSQKVGPSITLKVMKGDKFDFYVSSFYQTAIPTPPTESILNNIVNGLISGVSGSAVVNTHGITSSQFQSSGVLNGSVTDFLNNQPDNSAGTKPRAYVNWVLLDEQFNLVQTCSSFEQINAQGVIEPHTRQDLPITQSGYLYIYVSNNTPNIPVYFDNLKVKHTRGALLETNEFYPYGLKMASISYKANMTITNRHGFNGGNEYEDEGELNYSNTFYRKYDAQIGRFTGVDIMAEEVMNLSPYQFGNNNPVMFTDPMGDLAKESSKNVVGPDGNNHPSWWYVNTMWENNVTPFNDIGGGGGGGGGDYSAFWEAFISQTSNDLNYTFSNVEGLINQLFGYNYRNESGSGGFMESSYIGDTYSSSTTKETYFFSSYGGAFDFAAIAAGYAIQTKPIGAQILEATHAGLDMVSYVPIVGTAAAAINTGIYLGEGEYKKAAVSSIALLPFGKVAAAGGKLLMGLGKVEQYALRAAESGFYPVMQRGFSKAQGLQYLEKGDVWKFGTTMNPFTRYSQNYRNGIGDGVKYFREFKGLGSEARELQNMKITNYLLQYGHLPPGNKIIN